MLLCIAFSLKSPGETIISNDSFDSEWGTMWIDNVLTGLSPSPEIDVRGNGYSIAGGDNTPWIIDNTDYGSANTGIIITRTFAIYNTGTATLNLSGITLSNSADFGITTSPAATVPIGGNTTFSIEFKSLSLGSKSTSVTIANDDANESSYDFVINANSEQNIFDSDGDGANDHVDIDDDNDGIRDTEEQSNCLLSQISGTLKYKYLTESFGSGTNRSMINVNTNLKSTTSYKYENGLDGGDGIDLNEGKYTVYYRAANGDGINQTPNGDIASWADQEWYTEEDHTPGDTNGRMAMFNASTTQGVFYTASIKGILPNVPINFSFWALNLDRTDTPGIGTRIRPNVRVEFRDANNNVLTSIATGDIAPTISGNPTASWINSTVNLTFNVTEFTIFFINNSTASPQGPLGNNLAIDDIEVTQNLCDTDRDGVADVYDLDSDNDGIPDVVEAGLGNISQGKATLTYTSGWIDNNGNGMHDEIESHIILDSDSDGAPNYIDLDSDNDALFDVDESGAKNTSINAGGYENGDGDINGDGVGDGLDTDAVRKKDVNSDDVLEFFTDGILNIYDYFNGTTLSDAYGNINQGTGSTYFVKDTDSDGKPDYIDITSNGSTYDISLTLYADLDSNNDGRIDGNTDAEGDGLLDLFDTNDVIFGSPRDLDRKLHLYFDGRNDYAQEGAPMISGWGEATMMTWIKLDPSTLSGARRIMGQNSFYLELQSTRKIAVFANGTSVVTPGRSATLSLDRWYHVATTYSRSNNILKLFINGNEVASISVSGNLPTDTNLFTLGKSANSNTGFFHGFMDEVRVFNKALSNNEIQKIVYQEIQNNDGIVRGAIIPKDVTNYINSTTIVPLAWSSMRKYYRMDTYKGDVVDDLSTPGIDVGTGLRIYNSKYIDYQNAPLPFVTNQSGTLDTAVNVTDDGIRGLDAIDYDWSIVHVKNNGITYNGRQKHLGLIIDEFDATTNPIDFNVQNNSELNVSWYLKLDGLIKLEGESQLVQGDDSTLDVTSKGHLEKNQQGTADKFTYNYWSSPVSPSSPVNTTSNNNNFRVRDIMKDGNSNITWLTSGYDGSPGTPIRIADYWIWKYADRPDNSISSWQHIRSTGAIKAGEGYTMKGPGTGTVQSTQNYRFKGKPNNGNIGLSLSAGNDYLVGNPYPSAIDGREFIFDNTSTNGALYFWEHFGGGSHILGEYEGGYAIYNLSGGGQAATYNAISGQIPGRYVAVGQGFFVVASSGGPINFKNSQRVFIPEDSSNSIFLRESETSSNNANLEDLRMKFRIGFYSVNTIHRQLLLTADSNATENIDWGYDAEYIENQMDDMYWMINSEKFVIQGIDTIVSSTVLPLGLHLRDGGQSSIRIDQLENIPDEVQIFVYDKVLNTYHDLRQNEFVFALPAGIFLERYEIRFQEGSTLSVQEEDDLTAIEVYYANSFESLVIVNPTLREINRIELFNILGQAIDSFKNIETTNYAEYKVKNLSTGTYIVKLYTEQGSTSKKVLVK